MSGVGLANFYRPVNYDISLLDASTEIASRTKKILNRRRLIRAENRNRGFSWMRRTNAEYSSSVRRIRVNPRFLRDVRKTRVFNIGEAHAARGHLIRAHVVRHLET